MVPIWGISMMGAGPVAGADGQEGPMTPSPGGDRPRPDGAVGTLPLLRLPCAAGIDIPGGGWPSCCGGHPTSPI